MRLLLSLITSAAALRPSNAPLPLVEKSRRAFGAAAVAGAFVALPANAKIDVNNAMAREFSAYPGLFPTVGTKLVKRGPFKSKRDMYAALDTDVERAALRKYDAAIVLNARLGGHAVQGQSDLQVRVRPGQGRRLPRRADPPGPDEPTVTRRAGR
ncbi:unnamed protein product, partial [Pelagomonas calceolata]